MKNPVIVGLIAAKGAGKDSLAAAMAGLGYTRLAFADALYAEAADAYNCTVASLQVRETKESPQLWLSPSVCRNKDFALFCEDYLAAEGRTGGDQAPMSPREVLQQWGTFRRQTDKDYWLKQVENVLRSPEASGMKFVVTDVRFANEATRVESLGGALVRIRRKTAEDAAAGDMHPSETELRSRATRYTVDNNGTLEDLEVAALQLVAAVEAVDSAAA